MTMCTWNYFLCAAHIQHTCTSHMLSDIRPCIYFIDLGYDIMNNYTNVEVDVLLH